MKVRHSSAYWLLFLCVLLILPTRQAFGLASRDKFTIKWLELRTQYFIILYLPDNSDLAQNLYNHYGLGLDQEYVRFKKNIRSRTPPPYQHSYLSYQKRLSRF